jgi:RNA polymerase sigma-70 factor (ECF subfamily)
LPPDLRSERSYLLKLAHRAVMDLSRTRTRRNRRHESLAAETTEFFASSPDPDEAAFRQALGEAMAQLPEEQRSVVHLKLWEGLTFEAIGELLEIPNNTAASRYRYAVEKLRERLRPIYEEI